LFIYRSVGLPGGLVAVLELMPISEQVLKMRLIGPICLVSSECTARAMTRHESPYIPPDDGFLLPEVLRASVPRLKNRSEYI
jgi:hypothetical protein